jgi:hypothetical protein
MLSLKTDEFIKNKLLEIVNYESYEWMKIDINLKTKILHNYCNKFLKQNLQCEINIPLKSLKPKKFIQFCGFSKQKNKELYKTYLDNVLKYTFLFREKYVNCKNKKYFNYDHLSNIEKDEILQEINKLVYDFLIQYIELINEEYLFNNLLSNNKEKACLMDNKYKIKLKMNKKELKVIFNENIVIILTINLTGDKITNNIPVIYNIQLLNNIIS